MSTIKLSVPGALAGTWWEMTRRPTTGEITAVQFADDVATTVIRFTDGSDLLARAAWTFHGRAHTMLRVWATQFALAA